MILMMQLPFQTYACVKTSVHDDKIISYFQVTLHVQSGKEKVLALSFHGNINLEDIKIKLEGQNFPL